MSRSKWKGPHINLKIIELTKKKNNLIHSNRNSRITPKLIGQTIKIHNGKNYSEINITEKMLGHELGEFAFTRVKFLFKKKNKKK
jgi:ribosomal protein S19